MWVFDVATLRFLAVNRAAEQRYGYSRDEFLALALPDIRPDDERQCIVDQLRSHPTIGGPAGLVRHQRRNGSTLLAEVVWVPITIEGRDAKLAIMRDLPDHEHAFAELLREKHRLASALSIDKLGSWEVDLTTDEVTWSLEQYRIMGVDPGTFRPTRESVSLLMHPEDRDAVFAMQTDAIRHGEAYSTEFRIRRADGADRLLLIAAQVMCDADGRAVRLIGTSRDITDEREAQQSAQDLAALVQHSRDAIFSKSLDGRISSWNSGAERLYGYTRQEALGQSVEILTPPERADEVRRFLDAIVRGGRIDDFDTVRRAKDGRLIDVSVTISPLLDEAGRVTGASVIARDVSERTRAEVELRQAESRFRQLAENIQEVFFIEDLRTGRTLYVSPAYERVFGRSVASALASPRAWLDAVHPADRDRVRSSEIDSDTVRVVHRSTFRIVRPDGEIRWVRSRAFPVISAAGDPDRMVGLVEDITELRSTEEQLQHAQKMEAIGRLSGGIAHDFNNLLTAILGYSQMALAELGPDDPLRSHLEEIHRAGERAARLTRQLLTFSRHQVLELRIVDVVEVVSEVDKMLRRVLGEDVELRIVHACEPARVHSDPTQLDQVLMNLAVNARDAMPRGGSLTIATGIEEFAEPFTFEQGEYPAGPYVRIAMTDTGEGIDPAILPRIFEPFFTTKAVGRGTGLGLSTVYGIVKQSHGFIRVDSTPGRGTTFEIFLPAFQGPADSSLPESIQELPGGVETVLVVEDEDAVRSIAQIALERLGYRVLVASGSAEATAIVAEHPDPIHLLITDVVMPVMGGPELALALRARRPEMRVLFMSGYSSASGLLSELLEAGETFLEKPFTPQDLATKVRTALRNTPVRAPR